MARHGGRDGHRVESRVAKQLLQVRAAPHARMLSSNRFQTLGVVVTQPGQLGSRGGVEVPDQVGSPVAETYHTYGNHRPLHAESVAYGSPSPLSNDFAQPVPGQC